jgi:hypothetical protein
MIKGSGCFHKSLSNKMKMSVGPTHAALTVNRKRDSEIINAALPLRQQTIGFPVGYLVSEKAARQLQKVC